jgi:hypothetical protein
MKGDSRGKVNIEGGHNIGHCEENVYMNVSLIRIDYRNEDILISRPNSV